MRSIRPGRPLLADAVDDAFRSEERAKIQRANELAVFFTTDALVLQPQGIVVTTARKD